MRCLIFDVARVDFDFDLCVPSVGHIARNVLLCFFLQFFFLFRLRDLRRDQNKTRIKILGRTTGNVSMNSIWSFWSRIASQFPMTEKNKKKFRKTIAAKIFCLSIKITLHFRSEILLLILEFLSKAKLGYDKKSHKVNERT